MDFSRREQKRKMKSSRRNRYTLAERHRLGLSATARAAAKRAEKAAKSLIK